MSTLPSGARRFTLVGELLPKTKEILGKGGTKDLAAYDAYTRGLQQIEINNGNKRQGIESIAQRALARSTVPNNQSALAQVFQPLHRRTRSGSDCS